MRKDTYVPFIHIKFHDSYTQDNIERLESIICNILYTAETPLRRCLQSEVSFDTMPFPVHDNVTGQISLRGEADPVLITILRCHPDARYKNGEVVIKTSISQFAAMVEEAFLAYLAYYRTRTDINRRLSCSTRFSAIYDRTGAERKKEYAFEQGFIEFEQPVDIPVL